MKRTHSWRSSDGAFGYALLLPALLVFCLIILYPFVNSMVMSFTDQSMLRFGRKFIGLANFRKVAADPNFLQVLANTGVFVVGSVALPFIIGFIWALILNEKFRFAELLRGVTLVDWIIPSTAIGFLWMWLFNGDYGVINGVLRRLGVINENINWLGQERAAMVVVILARTWQLLPWYMAFIIGGLQGVSIEQTEAAKIDGASNWTILRHVVIPEMRPILYLVFILGVIGGLQQFDLIWVMTEGGPARATTTLAVEVYRNAFKNWNLGLAASVGVVWVLVLSVFSFLYIRANARNAT
jgi:multiple sugar transport system permease protein